MRQSADLVEFFGDGAGGTQLTYVTGPGWATTAALVTGDLNGDGAGDIMQKRSDGGLYFYRGDFASNYTATYLGPGWNTFSLITGGVDFNGDGRADLVARDANSNLFLYPGNGQGSFKNPIQIGTNWSAFTALVAGGSDQTLWLYPGNGTGGVGNGVRIGSGWGAYPIIS